MESIMSIEVWLNLIREHFSPAEGQILVQSLQQDPLVWQFLQDDKSHPLYSEVTSSDITALAPGNIALRLIEQSSGFSLVNLTQVDYYLPSELKAQAAQALETTFNTGLPPADLYTAGLLTLTLIERRKRKNSWAGISDELFVQRNAKSVLKNYRIWRTPFACLISFCPDFNDLAAEFLHSKPHIVAKSFLPILVHALLANPMSDQDLLERLFNQVKHLEIDLQLESLDWLRKFHREKLQVGLAGQLIQTKTNKDFIARIFSELETYNAITPEGDPLEKQVRFSLPEDVNRLAALYFFSGNDQKAIDTYQAASDLLEFLRAQTVFQTLVGETTHVASSKWLQIINSVPHSKQARWFYVRSLIEEGQYDAVHKQLAELPPSVEKDLLHMHLRESGHVAPDTLSKATPYLQKSAGNYTSLPASYFVFPMHLGTSKEILKTIHRFDDDATKLKWLEKYLQTNYNDANALRLACELYEKSNQLEKSIEIAGYLERIEPTEMAHKRDLARLYARSDRWQDAFTFLQKLVRSDSDQDTEDLELFAEAALKTNHIEMAMSICHNIIKQEPRNPKALVLLGKGYMLKGDVVKAIQHMENVVEIIPHEPETWITLAWLWQENDQMDRALETLKKGAGTNPNSPSLLRALGRALSNYNSLSEALPAFKKAYELQPDHDKGRLDLAQTYYQLGEFENSYQLLQKDIEHYEQNLTAAKLLGHVLLNLNQHAAAEPILLSAAEQDPEDLETVLSAACLVLDRFESEPENETTEILKKVKDILLKANEKNPENQQIRLNLADIDRLSGEYQTAFDVYTQLAKTMDRDKKTPNWRLQYGLGQAAMGLNKQEVGLAALQSALSTQPSNLNIRHALADAFQAADLSNKANTMAQTALNLAPQDLNNLIWYAKFKTAAAEPEEAVRALKEALQITPHRDELKLWLAKSLLSAGLTQEAHATVCDFIASSEHHPNLLHQAAYICVHINDLDLAATALEKALHRGSEIDPLRLMDLAVIYSLMGNYKKALDTLDTDQSLVANCSPIAILKADLLCNIGQYESAVKALESIAVVAEQALEKEPKKSTHQSPSPLLYAHDLSLKGYFQRMGHLSRLTGDLDVALHHFNAALKVEPDDISLKKAYLETLMMGIRFSEACDFAKSIDLTILPEHKVSPDHLDLICSQAEILLYLDESKQASDLINIYHEVCDANPRYLAIQSRLSAGSGKIDTASEHLNDAIESFQEKFGHQQPQALTTIFRKLINLNSIAEACLDLGEYSQALQIRHQIYDTCNLQPLLNWRYLYTLVKSAETQQIARALHITAHSPGEACLSEEHCQLAENLLAGLRTILSQEQIVCLNARIESAFTGKWPSHLNINACLQYPDEAGAVLMGSEDEHLVQEILATFYDEIEVLHAYGIYALRHNPGDAIPHVEHALRIDTANPISHALLAHLNKEQPEQALKSIETALSFWPEESGWHAFAADLNARLGQTAQAEEHIRFALEKQPENADYWQQSAILNAQKDDLLQAKADLEKSTAYRPDDPVAWAKMAEINSRMGETHQAIQNIRKASQLNPDDQTLAEQELQYLFEQNNYIELESKADQILSKDGSNECARIFLGRALAKQGKFDQALRVLKEKDNKITHNPTIDLEYLKIKKQQQGIENVLPELVNLAQDYPEDAPTLTTLIDWLIQANRLDEAEQVAQTAVRVVPDQPEVYLMLGRLQRVQGKLDQAISHLSQAITLDPRCVEAYIELGKTYQERRELDKAIETFEKGSQANHADPRPYYYAGLALKDCKDYQGAEYMLKQAKRWSPDDANIIRQLGVVTALNLINNLREV